MYALSREVRKEDRGEFLLRLCFRVFVNDCRAYSGPRLITFACDDCTYVLKRKREKEGKFHVEKLEIAVNDSKKRLSKI